MWLFVPAPFVTCSTVKIAGWLVEGFGIGADAAQKL